MIRSFRSSLMSCSAKINAGSGSSSPEKRATTGPNRLTKAINFSSVSAFANSISGEFLPVRPLLQPVLGAFRHSARRSKEEYDPVCEADHQWGYPTISRESGVRSTASPAPQQKWGYCSTIVILDSRAHHLADCK